MTETQPLKNLTNDELFLRAQEDFRKETQSTLNVLHTLREIERRRAYAEKSYPSLFDFCVDYLGYKKGAAYRRILAMRTLKDLPEVEEKIQSGSLSLMTLSQVGSYFKEQVRLESPLSVEQKREVIQSLENRSSRETERYFLKVMPKAHRTEKLKLLDNTHYQWQVTLPALVKEKLDRFGSLLGKEGNNLENIEVLEKALDLAIQEKERFLGISKKEATEPKKVPALGKMKRLWLRDRSQCTFIDPRTHHRCPQTRNLEIDHIKPRSLGGSSSLCNLRLLCKAHNQKMAIDTFGLKKMERFIN